MKQQELNTIWKSILDSASVGPNERHSFDLMLDGSKLRNINDEDGHLTFTVESDFAKTIVNDSFGNLIMSSAAIILKKDYNIACLTEEEWKAKERSNERTIEIAYIAKKSDSVSAEKTFENFVVSESNKLAAKAATAVAYNPGSNWTPLFIYGGSGLGKTHIMHAIGNKMKENHPHFSIKYVQANDFGSNVINVFADKNSDVTTELNKIRKEYESYDAILVDDIQQIATWPKAKEIFFGIFNYFIENKKQVIITSDVYAGELSDKGFEARFVSRFKGGLTLNLLPPDLEMSKKIIIQKLKEKTVSDPISITDEAIEYIAENFSRNVREIEGAVNLVLMWREMESIEVIKLSHVQEILKGNVTQKRGITPKKVINIVGKSFGVPTSEIVGNSRKAEIALARQLSMYFIRKNIGSTYEEIGEIFNKDHSTVMSSVRKIDKQQATDSVLSSTIFEINKKLKS